MKKHLFVLFIFFSIIGHSQEQQGTEPKPFEVPTMLKPPPDVAKLGEYGNIPVGHYTGIPNISIPLYTIETNSGFKLPISLKYHSSGVKVDEKATRVGLGWIFDYGGIISQTVNGVPDFLGKPHNSGRHILDIKKFNPIYNVSLSKDDYWYAKNILRAGYVAIRQGRTYFINNNFSDSQPDIFNYSIPGTRGKFIFDHNKNIQTIPFAPLKITKDWSNGAYTILDTKGHRYHFSATGASFIAGTTCSSDYYTNAFVGAGFAKKLSKIVTNTNEEINFTYKPVTYEYITNKQQGDYIPYPGQLSNDHPGPVSCERKTKFGEQIISKIEYKNIVINFTYSDDTNYPIAGSNVRKDFSGNPALRKIQISHKNGSTITPIKTYELKYDYFNSTEFLSSETSDNYRLKLTEIVENNSDKKHQFIYNETHSLPARFSNGQDYWGYNNGKNGQASALSEFVFFGNRISGGNRKPNPLYTEVGMLKKIIYPTKGATSFEYEPNNYYSETEVEYVDKSYTFPTNTNPVSPQNHTFQVTEANKYGLKVNVINDCSNSGSSFSTEMCIVKIKKDGVLRGTYTTTGVYEIPYTLAEGENGLTLGNYTMEYTKVGNCNCTVGLTWIEKKTLPPGHFITGGLRLKKTIDDNNFGKQYITSYDYKDPATGRISSTLHDKVSFNQAKLMPREVSLTDIETYAMRKYNFRSKDNLMPLGNVSGSSVGYSKVTEIKSGTNNYGKTLYEFTNFKDIEHFTSGGTHGMALESAPGNPHALPAKPTSYAWKRGLPTNITHYDKDNNIVKKIVKTYEFDNQKAALSGDYYGGDLISGGIDLRLDRHQYILYAVSSSIYGNGENMGPPKFFPATFDWGLYYVTSAWIKLKKEVTTENISSGVLTTTKDYFYDNPNHAQRTRVKTTTYSGEVLETKAYFPDDIINVNSLTNGGALNSVDLSIIEKLKGADKHHISQPIQIETYSLIDGTNKLLSTKRNLFKEVNGLVLPRAIQGSKSSDNLENRVEFHKYDNEGNALALSLANGARICYIWGYDKTLPIAKIENATYSEIATALGISESALLAYNESNLTAIEGLRTSLPNAMITTYVYKPLIGLISQKDERGFKTTYDYDSFGRLITIKDANNNIVKSYKYNYKQ